MTAKRTVEKSKNREIHHLSAVFQGLTIFRTNPQISLMRSMFHAEPRAAPVTNRASLMPSETLPEEELTPADLVDYFSDHESEQGSGSDTDDETEQNVTSKSSARLPVAPPRMIRWMDAYRSGMETQDAQLHVRNFGSKEYKSHRRIPERVAQAYD